jgi:hypothetical protein
MPAIRMKSLLTGFVTVAALTLSLMFAGVQGDAQEGTFNRHLKVTENDLRAGRNAENFTFHARAARLEGARAQVDRINKSGTTGKAAMSEALHAAIPAVTPANTTPIPFFPADVSYDGGLVLPTTTHHALYVNPPGSISSTWGAPEQYLSDLNRSQFIRLTDQYVGTNAGDRYPVGGNALVLFSMSGNVLTQADIYSILHLAAQVYGSGPGNLYHVFLPPGMDTCIDGSSPPVCYSPDNVPDFQFCGYHGAVTFNDIGGVLFTVEPFQNVSGCQEAPPNPNGQLADSTYGTLGHEVFETITDPLGTGWLNLKSDVLVFQEIGDECELLQDLNNQFDDPSFKLNGRLYQSQLEYSNERHACNDH